ncbi:MAG: helix-turn-helix domain-containing protein [Desulfobacteraceae bacterium]
MNIEFPYHIPIPGYLGKAIKETRKRKGLTQQELADNTGTSAKFISDVEREKKTVQIDKVFDLIRSLNLRVYVSDKSLDKEGASGKTFDFLG